MKHVGETGKAPVYSILITCVINPIYRSMMSHCRVFCRQYINVSIEEHCPAKEWYSLSQLQLPFNCHRMLLTTGRHDDQVCHYMPTISNTVVYL